MKKSNCFFCVFSRYSGSWCSISDDIYFPAFSPMRCNSITHFIKLIVAASYTSMAYRNCQSSRVYRIGNNRYSCFRIFRKSALVPVLLSDWKHKYNCSLVVQSVLVNSIFYNSVSFLSEGKRFQVKKKTYTFIFG